MIALEHDGTGRRFLAGQPADQPGPLIFAPRPNKIGSPEIEARVGLSFKAMTLNAGLLDQFLCLELIASCIWWWNPLCWYVRRRLIEMAEMSCDALALNELPNDRHQCAKAFLSLAQTATESAMPLPALGANRGAVLNFRRRLAMMLNESVNGNVPRWGLSGVCLLAIVALPAWSMRPCAKWSWTLRTVPRNWC